MIYRRFTFSVTQKMIDAGVWQSTGSCPVALGIKRRYPRSKIMVGLSYFRMNGKEWCLPERVIMFISSFDGGLKVSFDA